MAGLDTPTATYAPAQDPVLASLHQRLLSDSDPLRLASASTSGTTDFTPGPAGTDTIAAAPASPGAPVTDASLTPGTPPPAVPPEVASAAPAPGAVPSDLTPPTTPPPATTGDAVVAAAPAPAAPVRLAASDSAPAAAPGSAPATSSFSYGDAGSSCDDKTICNWRPNPNSTSQLTTDWFAAHKTQASAGVDTTYKVKFGDDLEGIAKRELKAEGKEGSSVKDEVAKIISLNHDHYKSLDCNKDLIRTGWTLKLNDGAVAAAPPPPADAPPPAPAAIATPDTTCKVDAPCGADVIVDNPNGQTFYNDKKVGDHDRSIITNGQAVEVPIPGKGKRDGSLNGGPPPLQRIGDAAPPPVAPAAPAVGDAAAVPPAVAPKPVETASAAAPDTPPPVVAPRTADAAPAPAAPDAPPAIAKIILPPAAPDTPPPAVAAPDAPPDASTADLTPGPDEVPAPVAPATAPLARRVASAPAAAPASAAPDAPPGSQSAAASPAVPLDGDALGPG
jgi:hypothetical protein